MRKFHFSTLLSPILMLAAISLAGVATANDSLPFQPGERLTYALKWGGISAGTVTFEVDQITDRDGVPSQHFIMVAKTNSALDRIYKVRDRAESFSDVNVTHGTAYLKNSNEGRHRKNIRVKFDWLRKEVRYSRIGKTRKPVPLESGTFDPLTVMYALRVHGFDTAKRFSIPVTDGKRMITSIVNVRGRKKIKVPAGTFNTILVEPDMAGVGGVYEKSKNATLRIWFTDDKSRIPVKFSSAVTVGTFTGELVSLRRGTSSAAATAPVKLREGVVGIAELSETATVTMHPGLSPVPACRLVPSGALEPVYGYRTKRDDLPLLISIR